MPKDMSYRKPAPKFIPSPPPSPPSSPLLTDVRLSILVAMDQGIPAMHEALQELPAKFDEPPPQLPGDWRDVIEQAMATNRSTRVYSMLDDAHAQTSSPGPVPETSNEEPRLTDHVVDSHVDEVHNPYAKEAVSSRSMSRATSPVYNNRSTVESTENLSSPPRSRAVSPVPKKRSKRRLHQNYRPPTPPLSTHYKKRRLPDYECEYSEGFEGRGFDIESRPEPHYPATRAPSMTQMSCSPLRYNSSVRTEKTLTSFANSEPSTNWSSGLTTCVADSNEDLHALPVLPMHTLPALKSGSRKACSGEKCTKSNSPSMWTYVGGWGSTLTSKLRSFKTMIAATFAC